jgi:hypothetical protein
MTTAERVFSLDTEKNVPALYNTGLFVVASGLFLFIWLTCRGRRDDHRGWLLLSAVFFFLSLDEFFSIHERLTDPLRDALDAGGVLYFAWVLPYAVGVIVLAALTAPLLLRLPWAHVGLLVTAGAVYLTGAVGMEMLGAQRYEVVADTRDATYATLTTVEEVLELVGLIILIYALLRMIEEALGPIMVTIHRDNGVLPRLRVAVGRPEGPGSERLEPA